MGNEPMGLNEEKSEIKGRKEMAFLVVMLLGLCLSLAMSPDQETTGVMVKAVCYFSPTALALGRIVPSGWLDLKRMTAVAAGFSTGLLLALHAATASLR